MEFVARRVPVVFVVTFTHWTKGRWTLVIPIGGNNGSCYDSLTPGCGPWPTQHNAPRKTRPEACVRN